MPGLWSHGVRRSTHPLQELSWEKLIHHQPYSPDLAPGDFYRFLHLKKFLYGQGQRFQNDREAEMSVKVVPIPGGKLLRHRIQKLVARYDKCLIPQVNMLKNSSTLSIVS